MRYQPIYDIAELCVRKNIKQVVLCPGSRCAPLTLAFTRHPDITTKIFSDERSAGFIALGMAQSAGSPVIIVCTSGTAAYNLAPSIAEAYFSQTPLVVFTADRPAEWVAQHDGQTIYQSEIFGKHVKKFFQLPQDYDHEDSLWAINRMVNEALNLSLQEPPGPVHINASFREPLYPAKEDGEFNYSITIRVIREPESVLELSEHVKEKLISAWSGFNNILLVAGQHRFNTSLIRCVSGFQRKHHVPVVHDIISNLHEVGSTVQHSDLILGQASANLKESLKPDLLITFGQSLISKNLKIFLRKYPAKSHWHIQPSGPIADTFKSLTDVFFTSPRAFLEFLTSVEMVHPFEGQKQQNYLKLWDVEEKRMLRTLGDFFEESELSELSLVKTLTDNLPEDSNLHLANSMSVRYANFIGVLAGKKGIQVFSNRGTSGIDGSNSTAVGHSIISGRPNFLITGDLAFFYDRNAFWHNYPVPNLHILLLNNHGGLIFDVLDGPSSIPEAREYFITRQMLNARKLCEEFGFEHIQPDHARKVKNMLKDFLDFGNSIKIMEFESDTSTNKEVLDKLKLKIKKSYEF
ncbi:MAG: 2-succinyl-5-enolpyruvyl-6-hydroxy-3-cyclohexene-1-carboxylic-acid synthase [Cyclobacteriaceae bacterium]